MYSVVDKVKMIYFTVELKSSGKTDTKNRQTEGTEILQEDVYYKESSGDSL